MHGGMAGGYVGVDRRAGRVLPQRRIERTEVLLFVITVVVVGVVFPAELQQLPTATAGAVQGALRTVWSMLFIAAGVVQLVRWRLTGEAAVAVRGCAVFCLGMLAAPAASLAPLLYTTATLDHLTPLTRAIAAAACLTLLGRAQRCPIVDTKLRPGRLLATTLIVAAVVIAAAVAVAQSGDRLDLDVRAWAALEVVVTAGWLTAGFQLVRSGRHRCQASLVWLGLCLLLMAGAELLRAIALVTAPGLTAYSTGIQLTVGAVALANALGDLTGALSAEGNRLLLVTDALRDAERRLSAEDEQVAVRRHDARSILASMRAATLVLDRYDDTLDAPSRQRLRESLSEEVARLESMVARGDAEQPANCRLDRILESALGDRDDVTVTRAGTQAWAYGRPSEIAAVVQTLVAHVGRRSTHTGVRVSVGSSPAGVSLRIEPARSGGATRVPTPATSADELGLYFVKRLLREQGAELVVSTSSTGSMIATVWLRRGSATVADGAVPTQREAPSATATEPLPVVDLRHDEPPRRRTSVRRRHVQPT